METSLRFINDQPLCTSFDVHRSKSTLETERIPHDENIQTQLRCKQFAFMYIYIHILLTAFSSSSNTQQIVFAVTFHRCLKYTHQLIC